MAGYLGNKSDGIVHHLAEMTKECLIYQIKKENKMYFTPDTLTQAKNKEFVPCTYCINETSNLK